MGKGKMVQIWFNASQKGKNLHVNNYVDFENFLYQEMIKMSESKNPIRKKAVKILFDMTENENNQSGKEAIFDCFLEEIGMDYEVAKYIGRLDIIRWDAILFKDNKEHKALMSLFEYINLGFVVVSKIIRSDGITFEVEAFSDCCSSEGMRVVISDVLQGKYTYNY